MLHGKYILLGETEKSIFKFAAFFKALILQSGKIWFLSTMSDTQKDTSPKCPSIPGISFPLLLEILPPPHLPQHTKQSGSEKKYTALSDNKTTLLSSLWCPRTMEPWTNQEPKLPNKKTLPHNLVLRTCCHS